MKKYEKQSWRKEEVAIVKRVLTENAGVQIGFVSLAIKNFLGYQMFQEHRLLY
jgi:predicted negative regulator of RcsB-dependent stress response